MTVNEDLRFHYKKVLNMEQIFIMTSMKIVQVKDRNDKEHKKHRVEYKVPFSELLLLLNAYGNDFNALLNHLKENIQEIENDRLLLGKMKELQGQKLISKFDDGVVQQHFEIENFRSDVYKVYMP